ncbi:MAG: DNA polymerase III subunit gamma/tau, partial [Oscillospiraceae bacterium]|nr:DNA polymerase III subunit gamma/tau [Oscillospiraceae bacterium]
MHTSLYRKWRPGNFKEVVGQDHVVRTLKNELKFGRIAHAYLFVGFRGTGKTTCAKVFAKAVNCQDLKDGDACCECEVCKAADSGSILDISELDGASNNSVNDIRLLCESCNFTPARVKYRVYIVDEVHMLSPGAFAALLKTLEEPPSHVIFILATTESHKLPATILSRCQRFEFYRIKFETIAGKLLGISSSEGIALDEKAALLIAKYSDGALRDALSLLDKFTSFKNLITEEIVKEVLGIAPRGHIYSIASFVVKGDPSGVLSCVFKLYSMSKDMQRLCEELVFFFRDVMVAKVSKDFSHLLVLTKEEKSEVVKIASVLTLQEVVFILDLLQDCLQNMAKKVSTRVELELALIKICGRKKGGDGGSAEIFGPRLDEGGGDGPKSDKKRCNDNGGDLSSGAKKAYGKLEKTPLQALNEQDKSQNRSKEMLLRDLNEGHSEFEKTPLQALVESDGNYNEFKKASSQDLDGQAENQGAPGKIFLQSLNEQDEDFKELKKATPQALGGQDKSHNESKRMFLQNLDEQSRDRSELKKVSLQVLDERGGDYDEFKKASSQDLNEQSMKRSESEKVSQQVLGEQRRDHFVPTKVSSQSLDGQNGDGGGVERISSQFLNKQDRNRNKPEEM